MLSIDDLARLDAEAAEWVADVWGQSVEEFQLPDIERDEVAEYDALTPEQHAEILRRVGQENYQAWANEMERLRLKHGGGYASDAVG